MKRFYYFGLSAAFIYIIAVILGGFLWRDYNPVAQPISELIMAGSPNQWILQPLFWLYNLLLAMFSLGFLRWGDNRLLRTSAVCLFIVALAGVMMLIFPQGVIGETVTNNGTIHLIFAGVAAISTLLAVFIGGFGFGKSGDYKELKVYSIIFGIIILASGPLTAVALDNFPHLFGVLERTTIGSFIIWLFLVARTIMPTRQAVDRKS